jgi:hypothetical protein
VSQWIGELLNRPGFSYKQRTEFYDGTGTPNILLRSRPVYSTPTIQVFLDESGHFGAPTDSFDATTSLLTYGEDYYLQIDQEDGITSRRGILTRFKSFWPKLHVRERGYLFPYVIKSPGIIKVVYNAGYTVDNLPPMLRMAANIMVAKMRNFFPLGAEIINESYENRYLSYIMSKRDYLLSQAKDLILPYRNWVW